MFKKLRSLFSKGEQKVETAVENKKPRQPRKPKEAAKPSPMELATARGEPYVAIQSMKVDPNDINNGEFHIIWNDKFVINLIKAGYKFKPEDTDQVIVDRWFQTICRNIALEVYEQYQADPKNRALDNVRPVSTRNLGNGRTEVS